MNQISQKLTVHEPAPMVMASGRVVDLANLQAADIHWPDLVENLVKIPRFNGATQNVTYTVAQHCCLMHDRAAPQYKKFALLYDFAAAFFGEPSVPFLWLAANHTDSRLAFIEAMREAKGDLTDVINEAAGLKDEDDDQAMFDRLEYVKTIDTKLTASEVRDVMNSALNGPHWSFLPEPFPMPVKAWGQDKARRELETRLFLIGIHVRG
ncbi:hypothetical protein [Roseibium album]|uniref:hypothetical protein n=1 Tax=Roseibium album TaxID=311410 RepID=UPI002491856E|nr:hypothetical protein [Roseibium album]